MKSEFLSVLMCNHKETTIRYVKSHPKTFGQAIDLMLSNRQPYAWRAAWVLWSCMQKNDKRMIPFMENIIEQLPQRPEGQQREMLKIIMMMDIPEEMQGRLFETCSKIWQEKGTRIGTRCNALKIMCLIAKKYPELNQEIKAYITTYYLEGITPSTKQLIRRLVLK